MKDQNSQWQVIGERMQKLRENAGKTQEEFSEFLDVSLNSYRRYEKGELPLPISCAVSIADKYYVSLDWVYCRSNNRKTTDDVCKICNTFMKFNESLNTPVEGIIE